MTTLERVCQRLDQLGIPHALIGAAALAAHGVARSTFDIDLLVADARVLDPGTWEAFSESGLDIDIRRGDADDPLGGVVRVESRGDRPVDIILGKAAWQARAITRSRHLHSGPPVVLARDLVLLKLYAGGAQDHWDIGELLRQADRGLLITEVDADVAQLGRQAGEDWQRLKMAAGTS